MGGVCSNEVAAVGDPNLIIDVQKVLTDSTWRVFKSTYSRFKSRFLKRKNYEIDVPMQYYHFQQLEYTVSEMIHRPHGAVVQGIQASQPNGPRVSDAPSKSLLEGKGVPHRDKTSPGQFGLETEFNNDTDEKQTYTFQFEKIRTASMEVSYQKGFSIGGKASFSIGVPKVMGDGSLGVEMDSHLQVTKSSGEKFEESLRTSAASDIVVSARSRYIATVVMEERLLQANFKTVVEMSLPAKKAPIFVKNLKTGETIFVRSICNLHRVFKDFKAVEMVEGRIDMVRFVVEGIVDGVQLSTHKIHLHSDACIPARKDPAKKAGTDEAGDGAKTAERELIDLKTD